MITYIDNKLADNVRIAIDDGKIKLFATNVQQQEIEKIGDNARKLAIKQMAEKMQVRFMETSAAVVGPDKLGKKGFNGSRVGMAKVVGNDGEQLLEALKKVNIRYPLKNEADLLIIYTAIKENMDFLVTDNIDDFKKPLELFRKERGTKLQLKGNEDISVFL